MKYFFNRVDKFIIINLASLQNPMWEWNNQQVNKKETTVM